MAYQIEVRHAGLHKYRLIRGSDPYVLEQKAQAQLAQWDQAWQRKCEQERNRSARRAEAEEREASKALAAERTVEAAEELAGLERTLLFTLDIDDSVDFEALKDRRPFGEAAPAKPGVPVAPLEPRKESDRFQPQLSLLDWLIPAFRRKKRQAAERRFREALADWKKATAKDVEERAALAAQFRTDVAAWEERRRGFEEQQEASNDALDQDREAYMRGEGGAVENYCDLVLSRSRYPDYFPEDFELEYRIATKSLVVDYVLPNPQNLPTLKDVKYVQSRDEFTEKHLAKSELNRLYDSVIYQVAIRTLHELFEADQIKALDMVTFNGWVRSVDRGTGKDVTACVLSVQVGRDQFLSIDLARVDPKDCFKSLKGVGSSKLHSLTAVAPIVQMSREDARFVVGRDVMRAAEEGENLAVMPWEDFEHLIRQIFEAEFSVNGGEVRVTQASRDGGVDAIAFDPDPIRGGKIVIQAKRYTKTVGVSAVRDLYGTVMNEGAIKGILVTTSDYGPDAYEFAKGKPLALLSGANLLHLLGRHGHKARIDIAEARRELGLS